MKEKHLDAFMDTAYRFSELSEAVRAKVGAIIVKDRRIISIGYNGMPSGWDNCCEDELDDGSLKTKPEVLHAEANAIAKLAQSPESARDSTLFCTHMPCMECAKLIHQSGIRTVYYGERYEAAKGSGEQFLSTSGIKLEWLPQKPKPVKTVEKVVEVERVIELDKPLLFSTGKLRPPDVIYEVSSRRDTEGLLLLTVSVFQNIAFLNVTARYNWDNLKNDISAVDNLFDITDWVIDYSYEAHIIQAQENRKGTIFEIIHETVKELNIPFSRVHLTHGNYFVADVYNSWKNLHNIQETLGSVEPMPTLFFHRYFKNSLKHYKQIEFRNILSKTADRHYCTFNGRAGYDRVELLKYLHKNQLLEKGYSTWHFDDESWQIIAAENLNIEKINRLPEGNTNTLDFKLISTDWSKRPEQELLDCYSKSLFEIVVETITNVDQESYNWDSLTLGRLAPLNILKAVPNANTVFLTEKTARPLLWGMPFYLNSGQYALKALRDMGFKTFDMLWDETYDTLPDAHARATAMHESIRRTLSVPLDELNKKISQHKDIVLHNQKRFMELARIPSTKLWIEMYSAKQNGVPNRTIVEQLHEPNMHIKIPVQ